MESQNGGAAPPRLDTKWEWANYSATNRVARGKHSRPLVQTTWSWRARQDCDAYIGEIHTRLSDALEQWRCGDNYTGELQIELDEAQRHADEVQEDYVHRESQQLEDAQDQIWELEEDLANTGMELRGEWIKVERITHDLMGRLRQVE